MTSFSLRSCFFAFHLLPEWLAQLQKDDSLSVEHLNAAFDRIWADAGRLAAVCGEELKATSTTPACTPHEGAKGPWWSVRMPMALRPPEPSLLVVNTAQPELEIYLSEVFLFPMRPMLWARIRLTGAHEILGGLENSKREAVIQLINEHGSIDQMLPLESQVVLDHLVLYAQVAHELKRAKSQLDPRALV